MNPVSLLPLFLLREQPRPHFIYARVRDPQRIEAIQRWLWPQLRGAHYTPQSLDHLHVTLLALPSSTEEDVTALVDDLRDATPALVEAISIGTFDEAPDKPIVLHLGASPSLLRMQSDLYNMAARRGLVTSKFSIPSAYRPHITLAYDLTPPDFDMPVGLPEGPQRFPIVDVVVSSDGYEPLARVRLPASAGDRVVVERGGAGSGHRGHQGIPGHQGGSLPGDGSENQEAASRVLSAKYPPITPAEFAVGKGYGGAAWMDWQGTIYRPGGWHSNAGDDLMAAGLVPNMNYDSLMRHMEVELGMLRMKRGFDQIEVQFSPRMRITDMQIEALGEASDAITAAGGRLEVFPDVTNADERETLYRELMDRIGAPITVKRSLDDAQADRLYAAENASIALAESFPDEATAQAYVDSIVASEWWQSRSPIRDVMVEYQPVEWAEADETKHGGVIVIPPARLCKAFLCHELAHFLAPDPDSHGAEYALLLLEVTSLFMEDRYAEMLREQFDRLGVVYDTSVVERGGAGSGHRGHQGIPGHQGGSLPGDGTREKIGLSRQSNSVRHLSSRAQRSLVRGENGLRGNLEMALAINPETGAIVVEKTGNEEHISFNTQETEAMRGAIFTHNHPKEIPPSATDLIALRRWGAEELRVVTDEHIYVIRDLRPLAPGEDWIENVRPIHNAWDDMSFEARQELERSTGGEGPYPEETVNQASQAFIGDLWLEKAEELGFEYAVFDRPNR